MKPQSLSLFHARTREADSRVPSDGVISGDDGVTAATLVVCGLIALALPRGLWIRAARLCGALHTALRKPDLAAAAETLQKQGIRVTAEEIARDLQAGNYLENIETVSEYLGYDGKRCIVPEGVDNVTRALEGGRGVILWHSPFCGAALLEKRGYACAGIPVTHMRSHTHPYSGTAFGLRVLNPIKTTIENRYLNDVAWLLPGGGRAALQQLTDTLRDNGVVSVTAIGSGKNALEVPFLGGTVKLARGVPSLARASGAAVIPTATTILPGPRYVIEFEPPLEVDSALPESEFFQALADGYAARIEPRVRRHPGSWRGWILSHTWVPPRDPA